MESKSNGFISVTKRSILAFPSPKWNGVCTQKRRLHDDTKSPTVRKTYRNRYGEEIVFTPCYPPLGYVFVPSGIGFITLWCRKLAPQLIVVNCSESPNRRSAPIGLFVPKDIFEKVQFEFEARRAKLRKSMQRDLDNEFPDMPPADKKEYLDLILSECPTIVTKSALRRGSTSIYTFVRDRYTPFKSLATYGKHRDAKAINSAHRETQAVLDSWRGGKVVTKVSKSKKARRGRKGRRRGRAHRGGKGRRGVKGRRGGKRRRGGKGRRGGKP